MIGEEFSAEKIKAVNFGVALRPHGELFFVPTDKDVQNTLSDMIEATVDRFERLEGDWEEFDISEDYGEDRRVYAKRDHELMTSLAALFESDGSADLSNVQEHVSNIDYYFAAAWDSKNRKAVGVKKATQFKTTLGARNRLVRLADDTLQMIPDNVLKLDHDFDAIITSEHVFILHPKPVEYVANLVSHIAAACVEKVQTIHDTISFLDLSNVKQRVAKSPRMARLAASISTRDDLAEIDQTKFLRFAREHGVSFTRIADGRYQPQPLDEMKLLEILDARRYNHDVTKKGPIAYRATARRKVTG